jgi:hypothetical protein
MTTLTLILIVLVIALAATAALRAVRGDGLGRRTPPRSHVPDLFEPHAFDSRRAA